MTQLTLNIENHEALGELKKFIKRLKGVSIASSDELSPSAQLTEALEEARNGKTSGPFNSIDKLMQHLSQ